MRPGAIRLGVVGVGDFGIRHARIAEALAEVELVAVADRDAGRRESISMSLDVPACGNATELLERYDVDALVIATPQGRHLQDIGTAVTAGVDVLVEKPVVGDAEDLIQLESIAGAARSMIIPAHVSRFLPSVAGLRQRLTGQRVHAVRAIRVVPSERLDLHGGEHPALVAMVHDLDLVRAFVSSELTEVTSRQHWTDLDRPHPQIVMAQMTFADGTLASVENHWTLPHSRQYIDARLEVTTDRETAYVTVPHGGLRLVTAEGDEFPDTELDVWVAGMPVGALATQLRHFARCVAERRTSDVVALEDAVWSTRVAATIAAQTPPR
jgi:predicted dehydrogenase